MRCVPGACIPFFLLFAVGANVVVRARGGSSGGRRQATNHNRIRASSRSTGGARVAPEWNRTNTGPFAQRRERGG